MSLINKYLAPIRHYSLPGTRALQQELDALREANAALGTDLDTVRQDLQHTRDADDKLLDELRQQIRQIRTERSQAKQQVEQLERSLAHAEHRQKFAESHMDSLEKKLEEERTRHDDNMQVTRTRLIHMQEEQRALLTQQTELTSHLGEIGTRLLDSSESGDRSSDYSLMQLVLMSGVLFITGTLLGVLTTQQLQDNGQELAEVSSDLNDLRGFMREHIDNQDTLIAELSLAINNLTTSGQPAIEPATLPASVPPEPQATEVASPGFTPDSQDIRDMQASLLLLGFNLGLTEPDGKPGIKTRRAVREFAALYSTHETAADNALDEALLGQIIQSAEQVRTDVSRYGIDNRVLAAIRLGSLHTGVDFSFLMELARAESNFNAAARAPGSSAAGLYQFQPADWLEAISTFGTDYGLDPYAISLEQADTGEPGSIARDPALLEVLALRMNPRLSTLLMAEGIKRNLQALPQATGHEPGRTDLYLAHLLGPADATLFLKTLNESPDRLASDLLPDAAAANPLVFHKRGQQPRTLGEVYRWLDRKFNTARYQDQLSG
jgi:hypothetical protein